MPSQVIQLPAARYLTGTQRREWDWSRGRSDDPIIDDSLKPPGNPGRYLAQVRFWRTSPDPSSGRLFEVHLESGATDSLSTGEDLSQEFEENGSVTITLSTGESVTGLQRLSGDTQEQYVYRAGHGFSIEEFDAVFDALASSNGQSSGTVTIRDFEPPTGESVSESAGASDEPSVALQQSEAVSESSGVEDSVEAGIQSTLAVSEAAGVGDSEETDLIVRQVGTVSFFADTVIPENNVPDGKNETQGLLVSVKSLGQINGQKVPTRYFSGSVQDTGFATPAIQFTSLGGFGTHAIVDFVGASGTGGTHLTSDALEALGFVFRRSDGTIQKFRLTDIDPDDTTDPYIGILRGLSPVPAGEFVLVDTDNPNVDWDNDAFVSDNQAEHVGDGVGASESEQVAFTLRESPPERIGVSEDYLLHLSDLSSEETGVEDEVATAFGLRSETYESAGAADEVEPAFRIPTESSESAGASDSAEIGLLLESSGEEGLGVSEGVETVPGRVVPEEVGAADRASASFRTFETPGEAAGIQDEFSLAFHIPLEVDDSIGTSEADEVGHSLHIAVSEGEGVGASVAVRDGLLLSDRKNEGIGIGESVLADVFDIIPVLSNIGRWRVRIGTLDLGDAWVQRDTVRIELRFNQRSQLSFEMSIPLEEVPPLSVWPRRKPPARSRVDVWWEDSTGSVSHRFAGVIFGCPVTINEGADWLDYSVTAPSLAARLDEVYIEGFERSIEGETVAQAINRIFLKYGRATGISTSGAMGSDVVEPQVWDYITLKEFLNRLEAQSSSAWKVLPTGVLQFRPRGNFPNARHSITLDKTESFTIDEDLQRHRTRQIVVGGTLPSGQRRDEFTADGNTREFHLVRRLDNIITIEIGGVSQSYGSEDDGNEWIIDRERSTVRRRNSFPNPTRGTKIAVLYDFNGTVVLAKQDQTAVGAYGVVTHLHQDSSVETNEEGETVLNRELNAHNSPVLIANLRTLFREVPEMLDGELVPIHIPEFGILNERWLSNLVVDSSEGDTLVHDVELLAHDYEELGEDYWRNLQRLTGATEGFKGLVLPDGRRIDENLLLHEGLNLPNHFGGNEFSKKRETTWTRVYGSAIVPLDGLRLPINTVQISFTAQTFNLPNGYSAAVRLYNRTDQAAVDTPVPITSSAAAPYFKRGITLAPKIAWYELQCRVVPTQGGGNAPRRSGVAVWGGKIDVYQ